MFTSFATGLLRTAMYRGRFAPSPTGDLHLGSITTALCAWLDARAHAGRFVLRMEDIDTARVVVGAAEQILDDLKWLGFDWDEGPDVGGDFGPYTQSERSWIYAQATSRLQEIGLVYPCDCSRAEIARAASAPHAGDEGPIYPGTCRGQKRETFRRSASLRFIVPQQTVTVIDGLQGEFSQNLSEEVGDFVLKRGDGIYAYQLAVVVDDLNMDISHVVRGADLLGSTPRQVCLMSALGGEIPSFFHAPLVVNPDGSRLAKRSRGVSIRHYREAKVDPTELLATLAQALGITTDARISARELVGSFAWERVKRGPIALDAEGMLQRLSRI